MLVTVFRTRQRGIRLGEPAAGVQGELEVGLWRLRFGRELAAKLMSPEDPGTMLLPELLSARVQRITHSGIVIVGTEIVPRRDSRKSSADRYPQGWWCLVHKERTAEG